MNSRPLILAGGVTVIAACVAAFVLRDTAPAAPVPQEPQRAAHVTSTPAVPRIRSNERAHLTLGRPLVCSSVARVLGWQGKGDYPERRNGVIELPENLSREEQGLLRDFIIGPRPDALVPGQWHALVNNVMNSLNAQSVLDPAWTEVLIHMADDPSQDVVLRDYAIQHLAILYSKVTHPEQAPILDCLWRAADNVNMSFSGTALLALHRMGPERGDDHVRKVQELARRIISSEAGERSPQKITADRIARVKISRS